MQTESFKFNVHTILDPLERFSSVEFNEDEAATLKAKQFERVPSREQHIEIYASTWTDWRYLVIVRTEDYRFIFYIPDDQSLLAWRKRYGQMPLSMLISTFKKPDAVPPEYTTFSVNAKALWKR